MPLPKPFRIIPCKEWGAVPASGAIPRVGKPDRIIFHHTAGHHPNLDASSGESYVEAAAYARAVQHYHMAGNGWLDSGHNFLVCRNGFIFEGRHGSLDAVSAGRMVQSAHCVGQNDQPGIEHEHVDPEEMTPIQRDASVWLMAWICDHTTIVPSAIHGHREYNLTSCPGSLFYPDLPGLRASVAAELAKNPTAKAWWLKYGPTPKPDWFFPLIEEAQRRARGRVPRV
jgi:N-acetylmuramoyl-L-alanine amidase